MRLALSSRALAAFLASFIAGAVFGACGDTRTRCARVVCQTGWQCVEETGACVPIAGYDAGSDAGAADGGADAGACTPECVSPQHCNPATGACVECLTNLHCACPTPVCGSSNSCVAASGGIPKPGEACATAPFLPACTPTMRFTAELDGATDDTAGSCSAADSGGRDVVYALLLDAPHDLRVIAAPAAGSSAQPVISLRSSCDPSTEVRCVDALGGTASFRMKSLPAGTWYLVIDSYDRTTAGAVDVTVDVLPATEPANDLCPFAAPLPLDGTPVKTDLSTASDDTQIACNQASDSPEVFYVFDLTTASDVLLTASGAPDAGVDAALAIRSTSCASGAVVGCADRAATGTESLKVRSLPAGTYYAVVESHGRANAGVVTVRATVTAPPAPPPANDTCAAPRALSFAPGSNTLVIPLVDTSAASDDTEGSCNGEPDSPEVVYELTLGASRTVTVTTVGAGGAPTDAVIYLRADACADGTELACADEYPSDTFIEYLTPGTYYLFVEGYGLGGAGPTQVTVTLSP